MINKVFLCYILVVVPLNVICKIEEEGDERTSLVRIFVDGIYTCGGVLVDTHWVVTSAICVATTAGQSIKVYLGGWTEKGATSEQSAKTDYVVVHPDYNGQKNDIAMVHLLDAANVCRDVIGTYTEYSNAKFDAKALHDDPECMTLGWQTLVKVNKLSARDNAAYIMGKVFQSLFGISSRSTRDSYADLKVHYLDVVSNKQCKEEIQNYDDKEVCFTILTGGLHPDDVGSPIMCNIKGTWRLVGLHSGRIIEQLQSKCEYKSALRLSYYKAWIEHIVTKKIPGQACQKSADCYGDDYLCINGLCAETVLFNGSCYDSTQCRDEGLRCVDGYCECKSAYVQIVVEDTCMEAKDYGESCKYTEQCVGANQRCSKKECTCVRLYVNSQGTCLPERKLGESCSVNAQCVGNNTKCSGNTCVCENNHLILNGECEQESSLGESCSINQQCVDINQECTNSTCACLTNHVTVNGDTCLPEASFGDACSKTDQCIDANNTCKQSTCQCVSDLIDVSDVCYPERVLGESCSITQQCTGSNQQCDNNTCECLSNHVIKRNKCLPERAYGENCTRNVQCIGNNQFCDVTGCSCISPYVNVSGVCYEGNLPYNGSCLSDGQCGVNRTGCYGDVCLCTPGLYKNTSDTCVESCATYNRTDFTEYPGLKLSTCTQSTFNNFALSQCIQVCSSLSCGSLQHKPSADTCILNNCGPLLNQSNVVTDVDFNLYVPKCA